MHELMATVRAQGEVIRLLTTRVKKLESQKGKSERHYQKLVEEMTGGAHLHIPNVGITDVTTDDSHIEIKHWTNYHTIPGQLWKYHKASPRSKRVAYLFGSPPPEKRKEDVWAMLQAQGIEMFIFDENDFAYQYFPPLSEQQLAKNAVKDFVTDRLKQSEDEMLPWTTLHEAFKVFCKNKWKAPELREELKRYGLVFCETTVKGENFRGYKGWRLTALDNEIGRAHV